MAYSSEEYARLQQEKAQQLIELVKNNVTSFADTEKFQDYLKFTTTMKNYSVENLLLIYSQYPAATQVAGLRAWNQLERQVKKGEKALKLYAPIKKRTYIVDEQTAQPIYDEDGKAKYIEKLVGFKLVNVFDVSQTTGKPLATARSLIREEFEPNVKATKMYKQLTNHLNNHTPLKVVESTYDLVREGRGYFIPKTNEISINDAEPSGIARLKTLIHEYAHALLHYDGSKYTSYPRGHREAQAESVAYAVMYDLGFDTTEYSAPYIATWAKDVDVMKSALKEIQIAVTKTIQVFDIIRQPELQETLKSTYTQQLERQHMMSQETLKSIFPNMRYILNNELAKAKSPQVPIVYFNRHYHRIEIANYHVQSEMLIDAHDTPITEQTLQAKEVLLLNVLYSSPSFIQKYVPFYEQFTIKEQAIYHVPTGEVILQREEIDDIKRYFIQYVDMEKTTLQQAIVTNTALRPFEKVIASMEAQLEQVQPKQQVAQDDIVPTINTKMGR